MSVEAGTGYAEQREPRRQIIFLPVTRRSRSGPHGKHPPRPNPARIPMCSPNPQQETVESNVMRKP
ncbi:hypothetical protein GCM10009657_18120 [Oryzihumus leptocrescens]